MSYLRDIIDYDVLYPKTNDEGKKIIGCCDSDWCGDKVEKRSKMGYMFRIFNSPICWSYKKQTIIELSTYEDEYILACNTTCKGLWLQSLLPEMNIGVRKQ